MNGSAFVSFSEPSPAAGYVEQRPLSAAAAKFMANAHTQSGRFQVSAFRLTRDYYKALTTRMLRRIFP